MNSELPKSNKPIAAKNLSFIYESVYKDNREEIDAIIKRSKEQKDSPELAKFKALNKINLDISPGKFIALVGDTGSGKSSLVRTFNGLIPSFYRGIFFGYVGVFGKDSLQEKVSTLSQHIGLVFQNPENQLVAMTVEREIAFGLENLGIDRDTIQTKINEIMDYLDIVHLKDRPPYELSGGEQQRVAIASILVLEPSVIILDEPTATLDPQATQSVFSMLQKLNKERNITIIIIEHRLEMLLPFCDEIIVLKDGEILIHESSYTVLSSSKLYKTNVRIPEFITLFKDLESKPSKSDVTPVTMDEATEILKEWLQ